MDVLDDGLDFFLSEMLILARGAAFSLAGSGSDSLPVDDIVLDSTLIGEAAAAAVFAVVGVLVAVLSVDMINDLKS